MCDVAIVGASVAGCTAARILFARAGVKVTLLERNSDPLAYQRVCTRFLQPSTIPILDRLCLTSQIEAVGGMPNNYELWTRWGWIRHWTSPCAMATIFAARRWTRCFARSPPRRLGSHSCPEVWSRT